MRQHRSPGALQTSCLSPRPSRSTCVTGRPKKAAGLSGSARRSGREPALRSPGALPTGDSEGQAGGRCQRVRSQPAPSMQRLDEIKILPDGTCWGGGVSSPPLSPPPPSPLSPFANWKEKDKNWGGGEKQQADPLPGLSCLLWVQKGAFMAPWLSFLKPGLTLQGMRREQHLGAGGLRPLAVG